MCNLFEERLPLILKKEVLTARKAEQIDSLQVCMVQKKYKKNQIFLFLLFYLFFLSFLLNQKEPRM